ncbi:MAG: glutathione synthase [Alphaproteobacteria bacterium GM7ARS4]|nr:glutathione synthase [Alphaproteobacteria bacterium GM7ARS4]
MRVAFQIDPLHHLHQHKDSSLALATSAHRRKYDIFCYQPQSLTLQEKVTAWLSPLVPVDGTWQQEEGQQTELDRMDVVLMRQDPPFDMAYITATYLLDYLQKTSHTRVINDPTSVRSYPEKYIPFLFPQHAPPSIISQHSPDLKAFRKKHGSVIIKIPFGKAGEGIFLIHPDDPNYDSLIETLLSRYGTPLIAQRYLDSVRTHGDKRLLLINGTCIGAFTRMPAQHDMRANLRCGGTAQACDITPQEKRLCQDLKPFLQEKRIFFAGIDVIAHALTEVNITSPTGLREYQAISGDDPCDIFWDHLAHTMKRA